MQTRFAPSFVVICLLLAVGLVVALVLWATIRPDDPDDPGAAANAAPTTSAAAQATTVAPGAPNAPGQIAAVTAFDPDNDGRENDELAGDAVADGDPATNWLTNCYANKYTGSLGVGIVATLTAPASGALSFSVGTAPYQIDVFASTAADAPSVLDDWGVAIDHVVGDRPGEVTVDIPNSAAHLLVWFVEIGNDANCSGGNPHRGVLGELAFAPA